MFKDPGFIMPQETGPENSNHINYLSFMIKGFETIEIKGSKFVLKTCQTCRIHRPLRTHHCSECGFCVEVMGINFTFMFSIVNF